MSECDARAYELLMAARDIFEAQDVYEHYSALECEAVSLEQRLADIISRYGIDSKQYKDAQKTQCRNH